MTKWPQAARRPPWRTILPGVALLAALGVSYFLWAPGLDVRDGRHDRGKNGIWISHGWLGSDDWFTRHNKTNEFTRYRDPSRIRELAQRLRKHHIMDVFPHLCPADPDGRLPGVDAGQTERFLDEFEGFRVMPWVGGPSGGPVRHQDPKWRSAFIHSIGELLTAHPRLAGVHLNVEPLRSGDREFLTLLEELRAALPQKRLLSLAAYPPPTRWHRFPDVHWDQAYFREVARRSDQLAVMMYDTALRFPRVYQHLLAGWTEEVLAWSEGKSLLLGVPTYDDAGVGYHDPAVEDLPNALLGIHRGLSRQALPAHYQGVAIYCDWETDAAEWQYWATHFLDP